MPAKATSISLLVLALKTWICRPRTGAAACTSFKVRSADAGFAGLTKTAMRAALGTSSCRRPSRFRGSLLDKEIDACHVAARSGEAGDQTKLNRVIRNTEDDRDTGSGSFGCEGHRSRTETGDHCHATAGHVGHERPRAVVLAL